MHEAMTNSRTTNSRGSSDKRTPTERSLSALMTDIPNKYVEAIQQL